jgi:hypothetical protein
MGKRKPTRSDKAPRFPSDGEIHAALLESGMGALAVERAMSQLMRVFRWDFFKRRKRRLYNLVAIRMGMVQLKEKVMDIAARHERETRTPLNIDDFFFGAYRYLLIDYGPGDVDAAIKELVREGLLRQEMRARIQVLRPTHKRGHFGATALRRVLDQMKLHLGIRYAQDYDGGRTFQV